MYEKLFKVALKFNQIIKKSQKVEKVEGGNPKEITFNAISSITKSTLASHKKSNPASQYSVFLLATINPNEKNNQYDPRLSKLSLQVKVNDAYNKSLSDMLQKNAGNTAINALITVLNSLSPGEEPIPEDELTEEQKKEEKETGKIHTRPRKREPWIAGDPTNNEGVEIGKIM